VTHLPTQNLHGSQFIQSLHFFVQEVVFHLPKLKNHWPPIASGRWPPRTPSLPRPLASTFWPLAADNNAHRDSALGMTRLRRYFSMLAGLNWWQAQFELVIDTVRITYNLGPTSNCSTTFFQILSCLHKSLYETTCAATSHIQFWIPILLIFYQFPSDADHDCGLVSWSDQLGFDVDRLLVKYTDLESLALVCLVCSSTVVRKLPWWWWWWST